VCVCECVCIYMWAHVYVCVCTVVGVDQARVEVQRLRHQRTQALQGLGGDGVSGQEPFEGRARRERSQADRQHVQRFVDG
jgi:hypothetical protein